MREFIKFILSYFRPQKKDEKLVPFDDNEFEYFLTSEDLENNRYYLINNFLWDEEKLQHVLISDLTREGFYQQQWVVLTDQRIIYVGDIENIEKDSFIEVNLEEIEAIEVRELDGNQIVNIILKDRAVEFMRASKKIKIPLDDFLEVFADRVKEIKDLPSEEDLIENRRAVVRKKSRVKTCNQCGKKISSSRRKVCDECMEQKEVIYRLLSYVKPYLLPFISGFLLLGVTTLIGLLPPLLNRTLIDDVLGPAVGYEYEEANIISEIFLNFAAPGTVRLLAIVVLTMLSFNLIRSALSAVRTYIINWMGQKVLLDMRNQVYEHLQKLSLSFFNKKSTGRVMTRVTSDVSRIESFLSSQLQRVGQDILTIVMIVTILFLLNWQLALIVMLPAPLLVFLTFYFRDKLHRVYRILWRRNAGLNGILADTIPGIEVVKAFNQEKREVKRFNDKNEEVFNGHIQSLKLRTLYSPSMQFLTFIGMILIWWFGGLRVIGGTLTIGTLTAFTGYMMRFYRPVQDLCRINHRFQRILTSADRVFEILDTNPEIKDREEAEELEDFQGEIEFKNITFSYDKGVPALKNVSFKVEAGEIIGLAGESGAGKTTLINLICRFYDPEDGEILIDGKSHEDIKVRSLRKHIGIVLQDPFLFSGTIASNIKYGNPAASRKEVIAAARAANAHDFIMGFSDGYESEVGERGVRISTGQRQRISIARAILKDPKLLILDEATSSVDTRTEAQIQEALERLIKGRTTFAIAHRLSTLRNADRLFILKEGEIVEQGTHDELLDKEGVYAKLHDMQRQMKAV